MPKQKTHKGAAKRFRLTKTGRIKRMKAYMNHIMNKKSSKRRRKLRKTGYVAATELKTIRLLIPYKR